MPLQTFDTFDCMIRPGGNLLHEVPVKAITARELALMRDVHGAQGVHSVVKVGTIERDDREEYFRIIEKYGSHDDAEATARMKRRVEQVFGVKLDDFDGWLAGKMDDADTERRSKEEARVAEDAARAAEAQRKREAEIRAEERGKAEAEMREKIRAEERERALEEFTSPTSPAVAEQRTPS